ncbi:DUF5675 family protein [Proteiniphilum sp. X52]|uniref:DUF5675 family protein n=1 Tax=Proteiniphilum sp. X52 TaxID=2382159 RepID=UPI000F0A13FE|nr:hypothetical protein D7D25_05975 [Proteiniphilum sp. X52]
MKLRLERFFFGDKYTVGRLFIDDKYFCDTLEDRVRDLASEEKVYGETAIPAGTYEVRVTWSPKFKRNLPLLMGVPHFTGIRIHRGNYPKDTLGCILVGENKVKGGVINSTQYELLLTKILSGKKSEIEIINKK